MKTGVVLAVAAAASIVSATTAAAYVWHRLRSAASKQVKEELKVLAKTEREGRVRLQIALGAAQDRIKLLEASASNDKPAIPLVTFPTIGTIVSPYSTRNGTPRQPSLVASSVSKLVLHKHVPTTTLLSLNEFSHAWVLFHFHQNTNVHKPFQKIKGTIKPPRLNGQSVGVLATRSPHRPAAIGLSLAKIVKVDIDNGFVLFQGLDLVHATPIVDIKPYVPFSDTPEDHFVPAFVGKEHAEGDEPLKITQVVFESPLAKSALESAYNDCKATRAKVSGIELYDSFDTFTSFVMENLMLDMRSTRERTDPKFDSYRVTLCDVVVQYKVVDGPEVHITGGCVLTEDMAQPLNKT
ncbi:unnamed protein product [Aphanomyces euteiches]|uniref:TsaA-like domain-containing protein n=1 Tax=Aphanomyces euteiches TaxID=100861 RepID=A0A6G0WR73_9STRA|nr:hypothetical protein Ae201684_012583 [Aphanomyces euteiches]KAH9090355.1 hypothetical protein Ae201684P_014160 [Aphanomyces euteiches]KAH9136228.1 hypothetical protein AeRB84_018529 [Aphanomyces euteiches]